MTVEDKDKTRARQRLDFGSLKRLHSIMYQTSRYTNMKQLYPTFPPNCNYAYLEQTPRVSNQVNHVDSSFLSFLQSDPRTKHINNQQTSLVRLLPNRPIPISQSISSTPSRRARAVPKPALSSRRHSHQGPLRALPKAARGMAPTCDRYPNPQSAAGRGNLGTP